MPPPRNEALFIIGMHRSGTSALSGSLRFIGYEHGARRMAPQPDNPKGFWEPRLIARLNEELLRDAGGSWRRPPDEALFAEAAVSDARKAQARSVWMETYGETRGAIVCKEPRLAFFIDLWREIAAECGRTPKFLFAIRDVRNVAASLKKRNDIPAIEGAALWAAYMFAALRELPEGAPIISFARLLEDPAREFVRAGLPDPSPSQLSKIFDFLGCRREAPPPEPHDGSLPHFIADLNDAATGWTEVPENDERSPLLARLETGLRELRKE
ncbi:MAG: hypothetical protein Tsb0010_02090 [Parvularculaceae bacterium]